MRTRLGFAFLGTVVGLLTLVAVTRACEGVGGAVSPSSAGPGDPITFSISGLEPGAHYGASIGGGAGTGGVTADGGGVSGSLTMPDLGDRADTVWVKLTADHSEDNFQWSNSYPVSYVPPVTTSAPSRSETPTSPAAAPEPQPQHLKRPIAARQPPRQRQESPNAGTAAGAAPSDSVGSEPGRGPSNPGSGSGEAVQSSSPTAARTAQQIGRQAGEKSQSVPHSVLGEIGSSTRVGPADVPTMGLLAIALVLIAGTALGAFVIYLFRNGPDPQAAIKEPAPLGSDPAEVELQEMIAEEMARRLLSDLDLAEPPVSRR